MVVLGGREKQDGIDSQRLTPPHGIFLYLTENKKVGSLKKEKKEEEEEEKNVHLLTHAPTRGMGKKQKVAQNKY